jgi:uncharacterized protein with GYD domain
VPGRCTTLRLSTPFEIDSRGKEGLRMPYYLVQVAYTPETWATLVENPQNRIEAVQPTLEQLGGTIYGAWVAFGEYDVVAIFELPDNVRQAAISMAIVAGGATKAVKTTPLLTWEEGIEAMRMAADTVYRPPSR